MTRFAPILLLVVATACAVTPSPKGAAMDPRATPSPFRRPGTVRAPELARGLAWLNTDHPLTLRQDLRGRVVLLDFWTYCCINCMHVLPDLKHLEERFAGEPFQVIGVHSGKFDAEKDAAKIDEAIRRYGIEHPVVVDSDFEIWQAYAVSGWPTLALIDAEGYLIAKGAGEPDRHKLEKVIAALIADAKARRVAAAGPPTYQRPARAETGALSYPGKVTALDGGRVAVADSGHHRILVLGMDGTVLARVGSGLEGFSDGSLETASFRRPQGIIGRGDVLYVADTENHAIRRVDLRAGTVTTVAGTGRKGTRPPPADAPPTRVELRSPWDLAWVDDWIYVAMAGSHQLWRYHPGQQRLEVAVGSGREEIIDGPAEEAALAQPSGLALDGRTLYFADSEVSAVRALDLASRRVRTLVGEGLFDFGDVDGDLSRARLQHPLGVAVLGDVVYVADTYNNKIRAISQRDRRVTTVTREKDALFEPGGLTVVGDRLLVADTNHHRLAWVDPATGAATPFELKGVSAPPVRGMVEHSVDNTTTRPEIRLGAGQPLEGGHALRLTVELPAGHAFTDGAPTRVRLDLSAARGITAEGDINARQEGSQLIVDVPLRASAGAEGELAFDAALYYCGDKKTLCLVDRPRLTYALSTAAPPAPREIGLRYNPPPAPR